MTKNIKNNVLLLGGSGMVGSSLKKYFNKNNILFESPSSNELNLLSKNNIIRFLKKKSYSHIVNSAAKTGGILANTKNQISFYEKNLQINFNLLEQAKKFKIPNLINLGSSCMYPKNYQTKMSEKDLMNGPLEDTNFGYALAKLNSALYLDLIRKETGLNYGTLIPCNLYGPNDDFNEKTAHLVPSIIAKVHKAIKNKDNKINIWGSGLVKREFMYVDDLSSYIAKLIKKNIKLPSYMNLGASKDYSIVEYYKLVMKIFGVEFKLEYDLTKPEGMKRKLINSSYAINNYQWKSPTSLNLGLKKTILFYNKQYV